MVRVDRGDRPHLLGGQVLLRLRDGAAAGGLNADLDHPARALECLAHPLGVVRVEGHRLFLVHVLARLKGRDEVQDVLVLGRRDQYGVDALVVQELAEVLVGLDLRCEFLHFVQAARVDIRHGGRLRIGTLQGRLEDLLAPAACADQAEANAIVGPQDTAGGKNLRHGQRRSAGQHIADKLTTGRHKVLL